MEKKGEDFLINLIWKDKVICKLSSEELNALLLLLPYWGLQMNDNVLTMPLEGKKLHLTSEWSHYAYSLMELVRHTGIDATHMEENSDLSITIDVASHLASPLSILIGNKKVRPKALDYKSLDLQKRIHKNAWLPFNGSTMTCFIKEDDHYTAIEWISYMIIQYFMKPYFKPVHHISIGMYERLVTNVLEEVNPTLASHQKTDHPLSEWPDVPDAIVPQQKTEPQTTSPNQNHQPINPFSQSSILFEPSPFDPFKFNHNQRKTSVINPFHQKK
ncbi:hypothetical protein IQ283_16640 [Alkalihalobacillus hwajinpoensis]|nr:hypothetical protein [Pseudalkalibacillus hwajinpoensis]